MWDDRTGTRVTAEDNEYAIFRGASRNGIPYWHVGIGRGKNKIERCFFDGVYGGCDEALTVARAYRDEALTLIPPTTNLNASVDLRVSNKTGITGIYPVYYKGHRSAWVARMSSRVKELCKNFSIQELGDDGAKAAAAAQREVWLQNLDMEFRTEDELATKTAEEVFPEYLENRIEPLRMNDEEIHARRMALDAKFDALRPLWATVKVSMQKSGGQLRLYVSDAGWPARIYNNGTSLRRHSRGAALAVLRAKAAAQLGEYFGEEFRESFLLIHGEQFNAGSFDDTNGIVIRDKPEAAAKLASERKGKPFDFWLEAWQVEDWRAGRHVWDPPVDGGLYAIAQCLADLAYQSPPREAARSPLKGRRDRRYQEAGVGISRSGDGWLVALMRQGRNIRRRFADAYFGGREAGLEVAQGYRDAVNEAFPDVRSYKIRNASRRNNSSGMIGVHAFVRNGVHTGWQAQINSNQLGIRKAFFSVAEYGDEEAKALAIAARQKWMKELYETAERDLANAARPLSDAAFTAKLDELDEHFGVRTKARLERLR